MPALDDETDKPAETLFKACKEADCYMSGRNSKGKQHKINTRWVNCDLCQEWYHGMCQDLQNADVSFLGKNDKKGIKWFCNTCCPQIEPASIGNEDASLGSLAVIAANTATSEKLSNIEGLIKNMTTANRSLEMRMEKLEKSYAEAVKTNDGGMRKTQEINKSAQAILQQHLETNQHEARKNNAIVYGIEEKEEMTALNQVKDLMKNYCFQHSDAQPDRQVL